MFQDRVLDVTAAAEQRVDRYSTLKICILLFLAALILRVIGINYGYWHGDERTNDAARVLTGQLVPGQHFYPPLHNYIVAVVYGIIFAVGRLIPVWHDAADFRSVYFSDPTIFYVGARFTTACMSALIAPLFYLIARELRFSKSMSLLVAAFAIILPVSVYLSHISKSDVPLATMTVATIYCLLLKERDPRSVWFDILLGLSVSLAFSFKHSFLFIAIPLGVWHIVRSLQFLEINEIAKSFAITAVVCLVSWLVFNVGIILDFANFLDYQAIQAQMSIREPSSPLAGVYLWGKLATQTSAGITILSFLLFLAFPAVVFSKYVSLEDKWPIAWFWSAIAFAIVVVIAITGERQHEGLWLAHFTAMQLFAALLLAMLLTSKNLIVHRLGIGLCVGLVLLSLAGVSRALKEAVAKPISQEVAEYIRDSFRDRKIVSSFLIDAPQTKQAQQWDINREQRLAKRYKIEMPVRADERLIKFNPPRALFYVKMPQVFYGLEFATDEQLEGIVKPHGWPLQKEEWQLDYWLDQGFDVFVLADYDALIKRPEPKLFFSFYTEMTKRCKLARRFEPTKPMYLETSAVIFDCKDTRR